MSAKIKGWQKQIRDLDAKVKIVTDRADAEKRDLTAAEDAEVNGYFDEIEVLKRKIDTENRAEVSRTPVEEERIEIVQGEPKFASLGEMLQAVARAALPAGTTLGGMPTGTLDRRLLPQMRATGMSEAVPSEGGFLVGKQMSDQLLQKAHETGKLVGGCWRIPIGEGKDGLQIPTLDESSRATGSRLGGIRVYRKNEGAAATASKPAWGKLNIDLEDMIGLAYVTNSLLSDATALEAFITKAFAQEIGFKLDDEILNGTGAGQCLGILASKALVTIDKETGQSAKTINIQNVLKMWARLWNASRGGAIWIANQDVIPQLYGMTFPVGTGGVPAFIPGGIIAGKPTDTLLSRPIIWAEQAASLGTAGDLVLADLGEYLLIDKGGLQAASSIHVAFLTNETAFRFVYRVNGQPIWTGALTPYKGTGNTVSPFVALTTRA